MIDLTDFKPTFIPWYELSFREKTRKMNTRQRMFYRNLLMECFFGDLRPALTSDDNLLWELAEADSLNEWLQNKDAVLKHFFQGTDQTTGAVILKNKRVEEEWAKMIGFLEKKSNAGKASAAARQARMGGEKSPSHSPKKEKKKDSTSQLQLHKTVEECSTGVQQVLEGAEVVEGEGSSLPSDNKKQPKSTMANIQAIAEQILGEPVQTKNVDKKLAAAFEKEVGREVLSMAWAVWLLDDSNLTMTTANGEGVSIIYLLNHFFENGYAENIADKVRPLVEIGFQNPYIVRWIFAIDCGHEAEMLTPSEIRFLETGNFDYEGGYAKFYGETRGTLKDYIARLGYREPIPAELIAPEQNQQEITV